MDTKQMIKNIEGKLTITRRRDQDDNTYMYIELEDKNIT